MATVSWKTLLTRLQRLRDSAVMLKDIDGKPIVDAAHPHQPIHGYPFVKGDALGVLTSWLRDAESLLLSTGRQGDAQRLDRILSEFTGLPLPRVSELSLRDFAPPARDPDDGDPGYYDPLDARLGFHLLVEVLLIEARAWADTRSEISAPKGFDPNARYWTMDQMIAFYGGSRKTCLNYISACRARNGGDDPRWLKRHPGRVRGWWIDAPVYAAFVRRGKVDLPPRFKY